MNFDFDPDRYLVLRIDSPLPAGLSKLQSMDALRPDLVDKLRASPPKLALETTRLSGKQKQEVTRDPAQEVAGGIPVALVQPIPSSAGAASDPVQKAKAAQATWGVEAVRAKGYAISPNRPAERDIPVAVLDTGIDRQHSAFHGIRTWHVRNFTNPETDVKSEDVSDGFGHGTHCASTIFGQDVDGVHIGVAPGVTTAIIAKVLDDEGHGSNEAVANALQWAASKGARIISMSLGFDFSTMVELLKAAKWPERAAVSRALQAYRENVRYFDRLVGFLANNDDRLLIAAAGNDSRRGAAPQRDQLIDVSMPAAAEKVISVGALGRTADGFSVAPFSNINPIISAPGVDIVGAKVGGGLVAMSGTSMACPHVAGLAALWWDSQLVQNGQTSADEVRGSLRAFAVNVKLERADQGSGLAVAPTVQ